MSGTGAEAVICSLLFQQFLFSFFSLQVAKQAARK